jgi:hypothetical protein
MQFKFTVMYSRYSTTTLFRPKARPLEQNHACDIKDKENINSFVLNLTLSVDKRSSSVIRQHIK